MSTEPTTNIRALAAAVCVSDAEMASLVWLAGFERHTVENIASVITRVRRNPSGPSIKIHRQNRT